MRLPLLTFAIAVLPAAGCGSRVPDAAAAMPAYDPAGMAKSAVQALDKNGNGRIEGAELDAAPGLKAALAAIDANRDKQVSAEELEQRFQQYRTAGASGFTVSCSVTLNGNAYEGVAVTLVPEPFMGDGFKSFTGKTDADGGVAFPADDTGLPAVPAGLYRIQVSWGGGTSSGGGRVGPVPPQFNDKTTLGREVFIEGGRGATIDVTLNLTYR